MFPCLFFGISLFRKLHNSRECPNGIGQTVQLDTCIQLRAHIVFVSCLLFVVSCRIKDSSFNIQTSTFNIYYNQQLTTNNYLSSEMRTYLIMLIISSCTGNEPPTFPNATFGEPVVMGELRGADMSEASGIVASSAHPSHYWTHNDSGHPAELFLIDSTGLAKAVFNLPDITNRDFEDIARRGDTLFLADIGDNASIFSEIRVYTILEPKNAVSGNLTPNGIYRMRYPDGPRDAETLIVDPITGDWYIITKREQNVRLYRYPSPQSRSGTYTLERIPGMLPLTRVVAGDISTDGSEILLKTYKEVFYYPRVGNEPLSVTLMRPGIRQPYEEEPQGEALAFTIREDGYVTTTERVGGKAQWIKLYRRK